jgi:hypothetical protein
MTKESENPDRTKADEVGWKRFVTEMYGCLADAPIERGAEGSLESRLAFDPHPGMNARATRQRRVNPASKSTRLKPPSGGAAT